MYHGVGLVTFYIKPLQLTSVLVGGLKMVLEVKHCIFYYNNNNNNNVPLLPGMLLQTKLWLNMAGKRARG